MYHSIIISGKNTYEEWGLIPTERPIVSPPTPKTSIVEIPGTSESIDNTEVLTGRIQYGQRTGSWSFYFDPEWTNEDIPNSNRLRLEGTLWAKVYSSLLNYTHGKTHTVVLEDWPSIEYTGRLTLSDWSSNGKYSTVTISYNFDPPERD